jgi:nitrite reductase (NADH) large subunit
MQSHYDLLIVGGGMAAGRLMQQLDELGYSKSVAVVSNEAYTGYNRVLLPGFLAGHYKTSDLTANDSWSLRSNFIVLPNSQVHEIDFKARTAHVNSDVSIRFSELVFATGSTVPRLNIPGAGKNNVFELRSLDNAEQLKKVAAMATNAVVIGGGLLGLEAADALKDLGLKIRIVHRGPQLMNRQLDQIAGDQLAQKLIDEGITLNLDAQVKKIIGTDQVSAVELSGGAIHATDLVLFATGAVPNVLLAEQAGLSCAHGIRTDLALRTNLSSVYALGECANINGNNYSLVEATHAQADALAATLCGKTQTIEPFTPGTRLKVSSISVFAAGETRPTAHDKANDVVIRDGQEGIYRRLLFSGSRLIGAVLLGNTDAAREITQRIGTVVADTDRNRLAFGIG